ncbi:MAG: hypothetical protein U0L92_04810 [Clostridia bacterium]|nr:hypothetical protein [Clostridia bacterium]
MAEAVGSGISVGAAEVIGVSVGAGVVSFIEFLTNCRQKKINTIASKIDSTISVFFNKIILSNQRQIRRNCTKVTFYTYYKTEKIKKQVKFF